MLEVFYIIGGGIALFILILIIKDIFTKSVSTLSSIKLPSLKTISVVTPEESDIDVALECQYKMNKIAWKNKDSTIVDTNSILIKKVIEKSKNEV